jgi:putative endonuclease
MVFVEVKTKIGEKLGTPEEMVGKNKLRRLRNLATMYLGEKLRPCRIDVIAVVLNPDHSLARLTHYESVY